MRNKINDKEYDMNKINENNLAAIINHEIKFINFDIY